MTHECRGGRCTVRSLASIPSLPSLSLRMEGEWTARQLWHVTFVCLFVCLRRSFVVGNGVGDITRCDLRTGKIIGTPVCVRLQCTFRPKQYPILSRTLHFVPVLPTFPEIPLKRGGGVADIYNIVEYCHKVYLGLFIVA